MDPRKIIEAQAATNGSASKTVGEECRAMAVTELALWQIERLKNLAGAGARIPAHELDAHITLGLQFSQLSEDVCKKVLELVKNNPALIGLSD